MADKRTYTADQIATAARELREAAGDNAVRELREVEGTNEKRFTGAQVIAMLDDEIRILRERGFTDERIAELFNGFDIEVTAQQIARHAPPTL
jgi:hypothetical protein